MEVITRKEANNKQLKKYFTGKPCKHGHIDERRVVDKKCCTCVSLRDKKYLENNREAIAQRKKKHYIKNKKRINDNCKKWYVENREKKREYNKKYSKKYYKENRERIRANLDEWVRQHPEYKRAKWARRRAQKLQAMPSWADKNKIKDIYKNCPKGWHVDHIVPLQGENVCGLHVENNLQYLTRADNIEKSNKYETPEPDKRAS